MRFRASSATLAALGTALALFGTIAASPGPSDSSTSADQTMAVTVAPLTTVPQDASAQAVGCKVGSVAFSRTSSCQWNKVTAVLYQKRKVVGRASFTVRHTIALNPGKRDWSEKVAVSAAKITGSASGIHMSLRAKPRGYSPSKNSTTSAKVNFPQNHTLGGSGFSGGISYHDSVAKKKFQRSWIDYIYDFSKAGYTIEDLTVPSLAYRCDDMFYEGKKEKHTKAAGCVFYESYPSVSFKGLTNIAGGIKGLRNRGGHYGDKNGGKQRHALHITWDQKRIAKNRGQVCPSKKKAPAKMKRKGRTSCDEYPMASTYEGGTYLPAKERETTWATPKEQNDQGSRMSAFRKQYRVLDRDGFYVTI